MAKKENPLEKYMGDISVAASGMIRNEKDKDRVLMMALRATEGVLSECTPQSIAECIVHGFSLNLDPNPQLGQLYFIPFKRRCTLMIGYKGWVQLAGRAGIVLWGDVIHEKDDYSFRMGSNPQIDHTYDPRLTLDERGETIGSYCVWTYKDNGAIRIPTMVSREDLDKARKMASPKSPAWINWPDRMHTKVAINRAANTMVLSREMEMAQSIDAEFSALTSIDYETRDIGGKTIAQPKSTATVKLEPDAPAPALDAPVSAQETAVAPTDQKATSDQSAPQAAHESTTKATAEVQATAPATAQAPAQVPASEVVMATEATISAICGHAMTWEKVSPAMQKAMKKRQNDPAFDFSREKLAGLTEESARKLLTWMNQH